MVETYAPKFYENILNEEGVVPYQKYRNLHALY